MAGDWSHMRAACCLDEAARDAVERLAELEIVLKRKHLSVPARTAARIAIALQKAVAEANQETGGGPCPS